MHFVPRWTAFVPFGATFGPSLLLPAARPA